MRDAQRQVMGEPTPKAILRPSLIYGTLLNSHTHQSNTNTTHIQTQSINQPINFLKLLEDLEIKVAICICVYTRIFSKGPETNIHKFVGERAILIQNIFLEKKESRLLYKQT